MSTVHISSATHGKKGGDCSHVSNYVYRNSALVGCVQQVTKDIHICKHIHHHSYDLHTHTHTQTNDMQRKPQIVLVFPDL